MLPVRDRRGQYGEQNRRPQRNLRPNQRQEEIEQEIAEVAEKRSSTQPLRSLRSPVPFCLQRRTDLWICAPRDERPPDKRERGLAQRRKDAKERRDGSGGP